MNFADRINAVAPSRTTGITKIITQLRAEGRDIISLAVGEPDFPVRDEIKSAICKALTRNETRYSPVAGLPALRSALAAEFPGLYGNTNLPDAADPGNILITNGAKQALYSLFQAIISRGDEVLIPAPCWVSFPQQVRLAGGVPVMIPPLRTATALNDGETAASESPFDPDLDAMEAAVTSRTKAVVINSPNNPTGAVYTPAFLDALASLCRKHNLWLISDEAYEALVYSQEKGKDTAVVPSAHYRKSDGMNGPDGESRFVAVRSFSKTFSMTGLRIGYVAGPVPLIRELEKIQSHLCGNVCIAVQHGALAALPYRGQVLEEMIPALIRRRDMALDIVKKWGDCFIPDGAFYLFPDVSRNLASATASSGSTAAAPSTSDELCARILKETGVALVPGEAFEQSGCLRISYAVADAALEEGLARLSGFFGS